MGFIKNLEELATTPQRKIVLDLVEEALNAIQPQQVMRDSFFIKDNNLYVKREVFDLKKYKRIYLIGFGKGSGGICKIIEETLKDRLTEGYDIDNIEEKFSKVQFTLGTHPLPSEQNIKFTENVLDKIRDLREDDLVLVVICGGGSAMFEAPYKIDLKGLVDVNNALLKSGATISEMNIVRKHLSRVKGGGLAKHLYPATVASLIFSDVPGSSLSVIASGTTVMETSTMTDVKGIFKKYNIDLQSLSKDVFTETPHEEKYFDRVRNILVVSNSVAIEAMRQKALQFGYKTDVFSDRAQGFAKMFGTRLINKTKPHTILICGGETTVQVKGHGKGGRNQTLVLAALGATGTNCVIASFGTDGMDFYYYAGAIGDSNTLKKAKDLGLDPQKYLDDDNSYEFWNKTGDGIYTDRLQSNVSDLMIVLKD